MNKNSIKEILFYFGLIFMMVTSLSLAVKDYAGIDMPLMRVIIVALSSVAVVSIFTIFPKTLLAVSILGNAWLLYSYYSGLPAPKAYMKEAQEFFLWLSGYLRGYNYFEPDYSLLFIVLYTSLFAVIISVIAYNGKGGFALTVLGTATLSFFWFVYVNNARLYLAFFLFGALILYSCQVYNRKLKEWKSADSVIEHGGGYIWVLCSAITVIISLTLFLVLPLNISPVRWPWLNDKVSDLFPFIAEWRNDVMESYIYGYNSRYSLSSAGYGGNKLGGEIRADDSIMMTVKTKGEETLYLRGIVRDKYNSNSWSKSKRKLNEYDPGHSMPVPYGSNINTREKTLEITHKKLLTSTIFAPYSVYNVQNNIKRIYVDEDSEVYTSKMIMREKPYTVKSIMPYVDIEGLKQSKTRRMGADDFRLYTDLPGDISERVKLLALKIAGVQDNNYDKAKAIEKYLRQNYKYTLIPPRLPAKAEFTDYFLFEGKEGYCTYFATSMTVLLRAAGVPCRYVEGFISGYEDDVVREVRGTNAHAWVEVYFDDYGWIAFEPTPQYPEIEFAKPRDDTEAIEPDESQGTGSRVGAIERISRNRRELELEGEEAYNTIDMGEENRFSIANKILLVILLILAIRVIFMYLKQKVREAGFRRSNGRRFAADYLKDMFWYMGLAELIIKREETLGEYMKRIKYACGENLPGISTAAVILERIRYGNHELNTDERKVLEVFRKNVKSLSMKKNGVLQFAINSYILGDRGKYNV